MPVENQQADTNNPRRDNCSKELWNRMRKCVFKVCTVAHNCACLVSLITLVDEGMRMCTLFLRKSDTPRCAFILRSEICRGVLAIMKNKNNS